MPHKDLVVNGRSMFISKSIDNSLSREACEAYGLSDVDMDIIHTDLKTLELNFATPNTYGLVYYLPTKLYLYEPITSKIGLRLNNLWENGTQIETIEYSGYDYKHYGHDFHLAGSMGCTATLGLGLFLLKNYFRRQLHQIGILFIFDSEVLQERLELNLPIDDDSIIDFCRKQDELLAAIQSKESDCEDWRECRGQRGKKCNPEAAQCQ